MGVGLVTDANRRLGDHARGQVGVKIERDANGDVRRDRSQAFEQEALAFLTANKGRPFLLFLPVTVPHVAVQVPDDSLAARVEKEISSGRVELPVLPEAAVKIRTVIAEEGGLKARAQHQDAHAQEQRPGREDGVQGQRIKPSDNAVRGAV